MLRRIHRSVLYVFIAFGIFSCRNNPEPIDYGHDECAHCKMAISDRKFGGELITKKGKIYKFDSIECLAAYYKDIQTADVQSLWTIDFSEPGTWIKADQAAYLHSKNLPSPMGMFLSSYGTREKAETMRAQMEGNVMNWQEVMGMVGHK